MKQKRLSSLESDACIVGTNGTDHFIPKQGSYALVVAVFLLSAAKGKAMANVSFQPSGIF